LFSALYVFTYYYYFLQLGNLFTILHTKTILVIKRRCWNKKTKQIFEEECKTNKKPIVLPRFSINQEMKENRKKKLSILPTYFLVVKSDLKIRQIAADVAFANRKIFANISSQNKEKRKYPQIFREKRR